MRYLIKCDGRIIAVLVHEIDRSIAMGALKRAFPDAEILVGFDKSNKED